MQHCKSETCHKFQFHSACKNYYTFDNEKTRNLFEKLHCKKCKICKDTTSNEYNKTIKMKY